jgi:hypothetical protein
MATRKQRQTDKDNKLPSTFLTTRKIERESSEIAGCFKILWDKTEGEYIHIKEDSIKMEILPIIEGMSETATIAATSVFDAFLGGSSPIPLCCLRVGFGKGEFFAWLPYTKSDRQRLEVLAGKVLKSLMINQSIKQVRGLVEDETPHAEILKFGVIPEELDAFDVEDDPAALMAQVWLGEKEPEKGANRQAEVEREQKMADEFGLILAKLEEEKAAKKKALAEKKQAKALRDAATVKPIKKTR